MVGRLSDEIDSLAEMLNDPELGDMAAEEARGLEAERQAAGRGLVEMLMKRASSSSDSGGQDGGAPPDGAILEVRAGTGGDEAGIFAGELFEMYGKYARAQGWSVELMSVSKGDLNGLKEGVIKEYH